MDCRVEIRRREQRARRVVWWAAAYVYKGTNNAYAAVVPRPNFPGLDNTMIQLRLCRPESQISAPHSFCGAARVPRWPRGPSSGPNLGPGLAQRHSLGVKSVFRVERIMSSMVLSIPWPKRPSEDNLLNLGDTQVQRSPQFTQTYAMCEMKIVHEGVVKDYQTLLEMAGKHSRRKRRRKKSTTTKPAPVSPPSASSTRTASSRFIRSASLEPTAAMSNTDSFGTTSQKSGCAFLPETPTNSSN